MMQPNSPPGMAPGPPKRDLSETVWTKLDRKATAIAEFTMRQYRKKRSTWVLGAVGVILVGLVLLFYVDAMADGADLPEWVTDNDGDGLIDEDPSEWDGSQLKSVGDVDNDGDCWAREPFDRDWNGDGIDCNVIYNYDSNGVLVSIDADPNVDEDPNESVFLEETVHRSFLVGFAKFGFIFVLGLFIPMFLATGLIRNEQEAGTLHYLVGKPVARAEILMYRILGFLGIAWPYFIGLILLCALVTGFFGPGDSVFRFSDLGIWFGIMLAVLLAVLVYSVIFVTFGLLGRAVGYVAVFFYATFEFFMLLLGTASSGSSVEMKALTSMSVSFWCTEIINSTAWLVWGDWDMLYGMTKLPAWSIGDFNPGEVALWGIWGTPFPTTNPLVNMVISVFILLLVAALGILIGQSMFKKRELH